MSFFWSQKTLSLGSGSGERWEGLLLADRQCLKSNLNRRMRATRWKSAGWSDTFAQMSCFCLPISDYQIAGDEYWRQRKKKRRKKISHQSIYCRLSCCALPKLSLTAHVYILRRHRWGYLRIMSRGRWSAVVSLQLRRSHALDTGFGGLGGGMVPNHFGGC